MKNFTRILILCQIVLLFGIQANAQSGKFYNRWNFSAINGETMPHEVYTSIETKSPDSKGVGRTFFWDGEPSLATVFSTIFFYGDASSGQFYVAPISNSSLDFTLDYGFWNTDGDKRIVFDKVTVTTGMYKQSESPPLTLERHDEVYDCNIVEQNCRVYQRHYFGVPRNKVLENQEHISMITVRYYWGNKIAKTLILPYTVEGTYEKYLSTGPGPFELLNILRAAPGDQSYTYMEQNSSTSSEVSIGSQKSNSKTSTLSASATTGFSAPGIGGASVTVDVEKSITNTSVKGKENTYNISFTAQEKYENNNAVGDFSDLFIVAKRNYQFGIRYKIEAIKINNYIFVKPRGELLFAPLNLIKIYSYTEKQLLNDKIPEMIRNNKPSDAKFWKMLISKNDSIKKAVKQNYAYEDNFTAPKNGPYSRSKTYEKSSSLTLSQEISIEKTESITVTAEAGVGETKASVSSGNSWTVSTTSSQAETSGQGKSITTGYSIFDDDYGDGDDLDIFVWRDPVMGTPIWGLGAESKSSCAYEGGFQLDQPSITVTDPVTKQQVKSAKISGLAKGEEANFTVTLKNNNNKSDYRRYNMRYEPTGQLPNVTIPGGLNGIVPAFKILKNGSQTINIKVSNSFPDEMAFKDLMFILESECGGEGNDGYVSDTIMLSVFYGDTDTNRAPDNDLVNNAIFIPTDGSVQSSYTTKFGNKFPLTTVNATTFPAEQTLLPTTDCYYGWCAETNGLPAITGSVWFKFVAVVPSIELSLCDGKSNGFNSQMAVYKTTNINNLSTYNLIAANDNANYCTNPNSARIYLENLTLGDTLYVLVDGFQGAQGDFSISAKPTPPSNDNLCDYQRVYANGSTNKYFTYASTVVENEQLLIPASTDPVTGWKEDSIQHSVWFHFTAPAEGEVNIAVTNATFDSRISVYNYDAGVCESYAFSQFVNIAANDDPTGLGGGLDCGLNLKGLNPKKNYVFVVDGYKGSVGTFDLTLSIPLPTNDDPCNAVLLEVDAQGQGPFMNGGATATTEEQSIAPPYVEAGKPNGWTDKSGDNRARQIEHSMWFKFVAPSGGAVEISTWNQTNFITQLAVYKVGKCNTFSTYTLLAAEDNSQIRRTPPDNDYPNGRGVRGSILNLTKLNADSTYYILVDGSLNAYGTFSIDILTAPSSPPENDQACNAISLPANGVVQTGYTNLGATTSKTEYKIVPPEWKDGKMNGTVWFTFVAPSSGEVEISTCNMANFDTQLAVYSVLNCAIDSTKILIAANEDGPASCSTNGDSFLPVRGLTAGKTYYLVVDGYGNNKGNFDIVIRNQITPGPVNDDVKSAILIPVNGVIQTGFTNSLATATSLEQTIRPVNTDGSDCITNWCDDQVDNSVWFKFVAPANGTVYISTCNLAGFDTQLAIYETTNVNDFSTFKLLGANDAGPDDCATFFDSYLPVEGLVAGKTYYVMVDGFDGDNGSFDISLSTEGQSTAVTEIDINEPERFSVYPNPFERFVNLEYSKQGQIVNRVEVRDITGRLIQVIPNVNEASNGLIQIDLSFAPSGMLFLIINTNEGIISKKVIKY